MSRPRSISEATAHAAATAAEEHRARAARVLAHDDLVDLLRQAPIGMRDPRSWTGWIPPRTRAEDACRYCSADPRRHCTTNHAALANGSLRREALVAIAAEALRRQQGHEPAAPVLPALRRAPEPRLLDLDLPPGDRDTPDSADSPD